MELSLRGTPKQSHFKVLKIFINIIKLDCFARPRNDDQEPLFAKL